MIGPEFPDAAAHIWEVFHALHAGRGAGMAGPNPLSYPDIAAWSQLTGLRLSAWEVGVVKALDAAWLRAMDEGD